MEYPQASQERSFYHSFPRGRTSDTSDTIIAKGLQILAGIKNVGLVLAPEVVRWEIPQIDGTTKILHHRQTRICFTELSRDELPKHGDSFGPFSLEFSINVLRQFGVLPVIYVPQMVAGDRLLSSCGPVMAWMFENARYTFDQLDQLAKISNPQYALELARKTSPEATSVDPNYTINLLNHDDQKTITQKFEVQASIVRGILNYLNYQTAPFELMRGAIYAAQTLFYPTDDQINDKVLSYYRQREWRIIPGFAIDGKACDRPATDEEKRHLLDLDHQFWTREIADDKGSFRRIDEARIIDEFQGKHISSFVNKVIVPSSAYTKAQELFQEKAEASG